MLRFEKARTQFGGAVERLREVLALEKTDVVRDSAIQRFEFTVDLSWKALKAFLEEKKGLVCRSPKDCFREAFRQGIIDYDERWLKWIELRNQTSHTYNEALAESVYAQLSDAAEDFGLLFEKLSRN